MQEEVTQKTIALSFKATKLTATVLQKAIQAYLEHKKNKEPVRGKMSLKALISQNQGAKSIDIADGNIKTFEQVAKKYKVDFSVKKDKTTDPPKYLVFFKGKDTDVISQAFKEYVQANEKKHSRPSLKQRLVEYQQVVDKNKNRERVRERVKHKERDR